MNPANYSNHRTSSNAIQQLKELQVDKKTIKNFTKHHKHAKNMDGLAVEKIAVSPKAKSGLFRKKKDPKVTKSIVVNTPPKDQQY